MAVSKRLRYEILTRDNHTCRYCGAIAPDVKLQVDHVVPVALGGMDDPTNLVAACEPCNSGKTSRNPDAPLVEDVSQDVLRWNRALSRAQEITAAQIGERDAYVAAVNRAWESWLFGKNPYPRPDDWHLSVYRLHASGLPLSIATDLVDQATVIPNVRDRWRYFCGCCWNKVREIEATARDLVEADGEDW
jgi:hypothetical protein